MTAPRILIACVGNLFLGDDGFGVEVARRMASRRWPAGVVVRDFGIRGLDLAYALTEAWDLVILVDAAPRGSAPGTLHLIESDWPTAPASNPDSAAALLPTHNADPATALAAAQSIGSQARRVLVLGCEPQPLDPRDDFAPGLSPAALAAVEPAIDRIASLIAEHTASLSTGATP